MSVSGTYSHVHSECVSFMPFDLKVSILYIISEVPQDDTQHKLKFELKILKSSQSDIDIYLGCGVEIYSSCWDKTNH